MSSISLNYFKLLILPDYVVRWIGMFLGLYDCVCNRKQVNSIQVIISLTRSEMSKDCLSFLNLFYVYSTFDVVSFLFT